MLSRTLLSSATDPAKSMHDISPIIMNRYFHNEWESVNALVGDRCSGRLDAEREIFSVDHGVMGALLLETCNIPKTITGGIMYHHNPEGPKESREHAVVINLRNMFAKKINLRDNFFRFDEFLSKYKDFVYVMEDLGIKLMPTEEVKFFKRICVLLINTKGFFEEALEEKYD